MKGAFRVLAAALGCSFPSLAVSEPIHSTATLSEPRQGLVATTVGNQAVFAGGWNSFSQSYSDTVDIFDNDSGTWSTANLSQARVYLAATAVQGQALFGGGWNGGGYSNVVDIYNADLESWSTATLSSSRYYLAAASVGTKALFAGGLRGTAASDVVDIYDSVAGSWSTASLSAPRAGLVATTVGSKVLFAGGCDSTTCSDVVDIYDASEDTWSTATLSHAPSGFFVATTVGSKALFINVGSSTTVDVYDDDGGTWSTVTLPGLPEGLAVTAIGSQALLGGGYWDSPYPGVYTDAVDVYDGDTDTCSPFGTLSVGRNSLAATTVGNNAIFAGGHWYNGSANFSSDAVDIFTFPSEATVPEPLSLAFMCGAFVGAVAVRVRRRCKRRR